MSDRERSPRRERRSGGGNRGSGGSGNGRRAPPERRIFVSNIPFEMKWQEVKDMFRESVGDVTYVELFSDENDKPRGCGILEFSSQDLAKKAIEKMHRTELKGRKLVVKEDFDTERDKFGRLLRGSGGGGAGAGGRSRSQERDRDRRERERDDHRRSDNLQSSGTGLSRNTYGLSPQFLESLGIDCLLHTRLFVANLSYTVDEKKLREVFRLAGRVVSTELNRDKEGKSRGHGVVEFTHPVEAVQAISMFNDQLLFDRKMTVRFDKQPGPTPEELDQLPSRLPEGLAGVGMGLGSGGNPLTNVAQNLPSAQNNANNMISNMGSIANNLGNLTNLAALAQQMGMSPSLSTMTGNSSGASGLANNLMSALASGGINLASGGNNGQGPATSGMGVNSMGMGGNPASALNNLPGSLNNIGGAGNNSVGVPPGTNGNPVLGGHIRMAPGTDNNSNGGYTSAPGNSAMTYGLGSGMSRGISTGVGGDVPGRAGSNVSRTSDTILVRNLPLDCNWQLLREGFSHCGDIKYAEMKERGTGLIRFTSERDAERAMSMMDKQNISGRTIDVRLY